MVKRAVAIQVKAEPSAPKPGEQMTVALTLMNAGAGHKVPTCDPDRHFTDEFTVRDEHQQVLAEKTHTMGRWIMWQPAIIELYDNRVLPLASREYQFAYRMPEASKGLTLKARVRYHILTDGQHEMLKTKYGLMADDPYAFTVYEREVPLNEGLAAALADPLPEPPPLACLNLGASKG
jgi:hypothetical protein